MQHGDTAGLRGKMAQIHAVTVSPVEVGALHEAFGICDAAFLQGFHQVDGSFKLLLLLLLSTAQLF